MRQILALYILHGVLTKCFTLIVLSSQQVASCQLQMHQMTQVWKHRIHSPCCLTVAQGSSQNLQLTLCNTQVSSLLHKPQVLLLLQVRSLNVKCLPRKYSSIIYHKKCAHVYTKCKKMFHKNCLFLGETSGGNNGYVTPKHRYRDLRPMGCKTARKLTQVFLYT